MLPLNTVALKLLSLGPKPTSERRAVHEEEAGLHIRQHSRPQLCERIPAGMRRSCTYSVPRLLRKCCATPKMLTPQPACTLRVYMC